MAAWFSEVAGRVAYAKEGVSGSVIALRRVIFDQFRQDKTAVLGARRFELVSSYVEIRGSHWCHQSQSY